MIRRIWAILREPSDRDEPPHTAGGTAAWHALIGMPVGAAIGFFGIGTALAVFVGAMVLYWISKEIGDLYRGGDWRDGIVDAAFVALGVWAGWAAGPAAWWPLLSLACIVGVYFVALVARYD